MRTIPPVVRLGLGTIRAIGDELARAIVAERDTHGPYTAMTDLARRVPLTTSQMEALATAGAFTLPGANRRDALWTAGAAARERPDRLPGTTVAAPPPTLPGMSDAELAAADMWAVGLSPDSHPIALIRARLTELGVLTTAAAAATEPGVRILIAGAVTHRQSPLTAGGVTFLNLEDETGMINVVCSAGLVTATKRAVRTSPALLVRGMIQRSDGAVNLIADQLKSLETIISGHTRHG